MTDYSTPLERFQHYFNVANGLDEKFRKKIDKINAERFDYDVYEDKDYIEQSRENRKKSEENLNKTVGSYAAYSEGYDNSMQETLKKKLEESAALSEKNLREKFDRKKYEEWLAEKADRIRQLKQRYADEFGDAVYKMQKASEEYAFERR